MTAPGLDEDAIALVGPIGEPFQMYGFEGCTDRNPDVCACATPEDVGCSACGEVIEPGTLTYARQEGQPWMDTDDPEQDWITLWWHAACDTRTTRLADQQTAQALALARVEALLTTSTAPGTTSQNFIRSEDLRAAIEGQP